MTVVHGWAVWAGVAGAAIPVAVHLLTKPRPRRLPLSTIRFVRDAIRSRRARSRLRDVLILALRGAAVVLIAWAIARPKADSGRAVAPDADGAAARVVVLDVSRSMAAETRGVRAIDRARAVAAEFVGDVPGRRAGLIVAGAKPDAAFDLLSTNAAALRAELGRAEPRPERLNLPAAMAKAADLLAGSTGRREVVFVSDFQRTNWAEVDLTPLPADTVIQFESIAPAAVPDNLAVLRVGTPRRIEQGRDVPVAVEVGNYAAAARKVTVEVAAGDAAVRTEALCPPGVTTVVAVDLPVRRAGWLAGTARILGAADAVPADDVRPFVLDVRPPPVFALVTRQPADRVPSSSYYVERALVPLAARPGAATGRVVRVDPDRPDGDVLATADLIVVDHAGKLGPDVVRSVATALKRGRGVWAVAAEPDDATTLARIGEAVGAAYRPPVEFVPPPAGQRRKDLFLFDVRGDRPPFAVFGDGVRAATEPLRFGGGLASRRRADGLADDLVATYSDRSACLVVTDCGEGTLAVLNADLERSTLPASPAFVPLVGELTARLLGRHGGPAAVACGEPATAALPGSAGPATGLDVDGPDTAAGRITEDAGGSTWVHPGPPAPGVYRVTRQGQPVFALAAACPAEEADLRPIDPATLRDRLGGGRTVGFRSAADPPDDGDRLWVWLAVACAACVLGELMTLKVFRV